MSYFKAGTVNKDEVVPSPSTTAVSTTTTPVSTVPSTAAVPATAAVNTVVSKDVVAKTTTKPKYVI